MGRIASAPSAAHRRYGVRGSVGVSAPAGLRLQCDSPDCRCQTRLRFDAKTGTASRSVWAKRGACNKVSCGQPTQAICELFTHEFGHELRHIANGEVLSTVVCRNNEQIPTTQEQWKKAMIEKGWR